MIKLLKIMFIFLILFIGVVSIQFLIKTAKSNDEQKIDEAQAHISPEQMKLQTMTSISDIVLNQFLENVILNINLSPYENQLDVVLYLQANEFLSEEILLKDSYNILNEIQHVETVHDFTFKWHMLVKNQNTEILMMSFDQQTIASIEDYSYAELKQLATQYEKHEALRKFN